MRMGKRLFGYFPPPVVLPLRLTPRHSNESSISEYILYPTSVSRAYFIKQILLSPELTLCYLNESLIFK